MTSKKDSSEELKFFKLAKEINDENKDLFLSNQVHCRGNLNSMSLISVSDEKPELGLSGIRTQQTILAKIEKLKDKGIPKRPTPEKELQAWIIRKALLNNHILPFDNIKFITSEMAIKKNENEKKKVNDILGFTENDGLWVIELKSDRKLEELIRQVNDFEEIIYKYRDLFYELLKIYGCEWDKKSIKKAIVWPACDRPLKKTTTKIAEANIIEYGYKKEGNSFKIEKIK